MAKEMVTLQKHLEMQITDAKELLAAKTDALEARLTAALASIEAAVKIAEVTMNERLAKMNEFRAEMDDQRNTFITRDWSDNFEKSVGANFVQNQKSSAEKIEAVTKRVIELEKDRAVLAGKASMPAVMLSTAVGIIAIILGIANVLGLF